MCSQTCLRIFRPAESVTLICYTSNVRRSLEHLVALLSLELVSPWSVGCITVGCQTTRLCWTQRAKINDSTLSLTRNKEWTFVRGGGGQEAYGVNGRRHLGGSKHKSHWSHSHKSERLVQRLMLYYRETFTGKWVWHLNLSHWFWKRELK